MAAETTERRSRWIPKIVAGFILFAILGLLALAAFPFGLFKDRIAQHIGRELGTQVTIGAIERRELLSFTPTISIRDLAIRQPAWVGQGNMVHARSLDLRLPMLRLLMGRFPRPQTITAHGLALALVRDAEGRANWENRSRQEPGEGEHETGFQQLVIPNGRISLRDDKRFLAIAGQLTASNDGLRIEANGRFHDARARLSVRGGRISGLAADASYPLSLQLVSPLLRLEATGQTRGALNLKSMTLDIHAVAPTLKYLDDVIEAGLFGTRAIDLRAKVRHAGRDWFVDRMTGSIGRSTLVARADVLKREGRTKIDAEVHSSAFDFDDLSDAEGRARAAAIEARIGKRVFPDTRINLSKVGPTDGIIRFRADRLLLTSSAFRSLGGTIRLEGKLLAIDNIVAGMSSGRMTGSMKVAQQEGASHPLLSLDLAFHDGRLETLIGSRDATGPLRGRVLLSGRGDTIRSALAGADGRAGLIVRNGTVKRAFAAVLGQDLGKAIGAVLSDKEAVVPLRCLAIGFTARNGTLTSGPFIVDTGISVGQGQGGLSLADERIALSIAGQSRNPSPLRLADPIVIGGDFSAPTLSAAGKPPGSKVNAGTVLSAVGKSIGRALGLRGNDRRAEDSVPAATDCEAFARRIL